MRRYKLLPNVYAKGRRRSHTGVKYVTRHESRNGTNDIPVSQSEKIHKRCTDSHNFYDSNEATIINGGFDNTS